MPDRDCADALLYVLRTGCPWAALTDTSLCSKSTAHDRFAEWVAAGVFFQRWQVGIDRFDEVQGIDWNELSMGGKDRPQSDRSRENRRETQSAD